MSFERLAVSIQTLYADLTDRAWTGDLSELISAGGSCFSREINGRHYWYWQPPTINGTRAHAKYVGPDTDEIRSRLSVSKDIADVKRERVNMVRALRAARVPAPDRLTGAVLEALSAAGAFRLRAVVVGSVAFQCYSPLLGVRLSDALARTGDVDIAQFHSISMAVEDEISDDFLSVLKTVDKKFVPISSPIDGRKTLRYALRVGNQEVYSVDVLSPWRGAEHPRITDLKALRSSAQLLRYLDYLLYHEVNVVTLYGAGIPINVPSPERYALHKLLVSQMRTSLPQSQAKSRKDLAQAAALIEVLAADRPLELKYAWEELRERGPSWRQKADASVKSLPEDIRLLLNDILDGTVPAPR